MKRGKKLISLLVVLVLVLGATWAATLLNPENAEEEVVYHTIFTVNADEVTQISWDYKEPLSFTKVDGEWIYDEDPSFPLDDDYIDTMLVNVKEIVSTKTIEAVEDWDEYTLEVPICEITVTAGDTTSTLKIGEETSLGGERYLSIGDGNAYLVDADLLDAFSYGLYDVLKMETIPEMDTISGMDITTGDGGYEIRMMENSGLAYTDAYVWFIDEKPLDTELTESLTRYITDLYWKECANYNAEDLSQYGLESPAASITMHYLENEYVQTEETDEDGNTIYESHSQEHTFTVEIGAACSDGYYARIADSSMVYVISTSVAEKLLFTTYQDLQPDEVLLMDWEDVTSLDVILDGETYTITRGTETVTDDEGSESEKTVYRLAGEEVDAESILELLDDLESAGYANGLTPDRKEEIRFVIHRNHKTYPEVELAIYQYNSANCLVTLNGEATLFVEREAVVELVEAVNGIVLK